MNNGAKGIDVSNYQGNIDWNKVKADGVEFVIIRAGWGKSGRDPKFKEYIDGAIKVGLNIGIYWFLYAKNENDIVGNANSCVSVIGAYKDKINLKVWADWEYDSDNYCSGLSKDTRTKWVKRFCQEVEKYGFETGIYANPDYIKNKFNDISDYPLWLAYYSNSKGSYNPYMWQYSSKGKVNGISGNVDMDIYYGGEIAQKTTTATVTTTANTYTVKAGDTLNSIANKFNVTVDEIMAINSQIKNRNIINIGQKISIPSAVKKNPYKEPTNDVTFGSKGEGVKWVQWALNNKGYKLDEDGVYGNKTLEAVKDFKIKNKLTDGNVTVDTRKALR